MSSDRLSLREAADELGLHYMTVYRYVRTGLLPATKDGGMWWVKVADLRNLQVSPSAEVGRGKRDLARLVPRLVNALVSGDESGVWRIADSQKQAGCGIEEFCIDLLVPTMDKIGKEWPTSTVPRRWFPRCSVAFGRHPDRLDGSEDSSSSVARRPKSTAFQQQSSRSYCVVVDSRCKTSEPTPRPCPSWTFARMQTDL